MKRFTLSLAALTLGASVGAQAMGQFIPPPQHPQFIIGGSALWLQASDPNTVYATRTSSWNPAVGSFTSNLRVNTLHIDQNYDIGFDVFAGFFFNPYDDIMVRYQRWHDSDSAWAGPRGNNTLGPISPFNNFWLSISPVTDPRDLTKAQGHLEYKEDQVTITMGHTLDSTHGLLLRVFAGAMWGEVERDFDARYTLSNVSGTLPLLTSNQFSFWSHNDFSGWGPVVGMNAHYAIMDTGFGLHAMSSVAVLFGDIDTHVMDSFPATIASGATTNNTTTIKNCDGTKAVPVVSVKAGADYVYNWQGYRFVLAAGYRVKYFFNVYNDDTLFRGVVPNDTDAPLSVAPRSIGFHGPYVTLAVMIPQIFG